jgi:hypothetical protein
MKRAARLHGAQQAAVGDEPHGEDRRQGGGHHPFLNGEALLQVVPIDELDLTGNARPPSDQKLRVPAPASDEPLAPSL